MVAYHLTVTIHLLAALVWLGGMFFLALVGAPVLRKVEPPELRTELFRRLGEQFRLVGWVAIATLLITGVLNLHFRALLRWNILSAPTFWGSPVGRALAWKLSAVVVMVALSALHDFWVGPRAGRVDPDSREARRLRVWSAWTARANALVGLLLVYWAIRLARGG